MRDAAGSKHLAMSFLFLYQNNLDTGRSEGEQQALAGSLSRLLDKAAEKAISEQELLRTDVEVEDGWDERTQPMARATIDGLLDTLR